MTALMLGDADRVLTPPTAPFTSVAFGDLTLAADSEVTPGAWYDATTIPLDDSGNELTASPNTLPQNTATFIAVAGAVGVDTHNIWWAQAGGFDFAYSTAEIDYLQLPGTGYQDNDQALPAPLGSGVTVWAIVSNSTEGRILNSRSGTVGTVEGPQTDPGDTGTLYIGIGWGNTGSAAHHLLGVWQFHDVTVSETDAVDTMAAIVAELEAAAGAPKAVSGSGGWGVGGAGAPVNVDDVAFPPEPPVLEAGGSVTPPDEPALVVPENVPDPVIRIVADTYAAPTEPVELDEDGRVLRWEPTDRVNEPYARFQTVVEGVDVSWVNGVPTPVPSFARVEPFGSHSATLEFPGVSVFHARPAWAKNGANVSLHLVKLAGGTVRRFTGVVMNVGRTEDAGVLRLDCHGIMFVGDEQPRRPSFSTAPLDIGTAIARACNAVVSRRYATMAAVATGATTSVEGGWEPTMSGYVQRLLATALTDAGEQWTVKCADRSPVLAKKDTTTILASIRAGQPGIAVDLDDDAAESPNLFYGEGTNPDGGRWRNAKFPNWKPDDTPPYPYDPPDTSIRVGTRDSSTDTGDGVSVWQAKVGRPVTGYFSTADRDELVRIQRRTGILVDGILGPQSWAATFDTGANTGTLDGAFVAPLAAAPEVMPRLYGPDGDDRGPNPAYDAGVVPVARRVQYGPGVWKSEGIRDAERALKREAGPGWAGTITLDVDLPGPVSRFEINEGTNIRVLGWHQQTVDVHVSGVDVNPEDGEAGQVRLTVDSRARDYPTLDAIRNRERNATDPARDAYLRLSSGNLSTDRPTFDAESPAGRMPRHALYGGLWDVRRIPLGAYGSVARTVFTTSAPARAFALAVFMQPVTAQNLVDLMGNPLTASSDPWAEHGDALDAMGFRQAWGWKEQPAGYFPNVYNTPDGTSGAAVTGRLVDDAPWEFASSQSPWVWVAAIASGSCNIEGRFYGAAVGW